MTHCDLDVLKHQFPIVKLFIYHLIYARIVRESYRTSQIQNEFWSLTSDAHLLRAVNYWCMVFGKDNEATHWKCLVKKSKDDVRAFREGLFRETGLDEDGWRDYWTGITTFRDKYAAHRELEPFTDPVPDFDNTLLVAHYYDWWVRNIVAPPGIWEEPPLKQFTQSLQQSTFPLINKLLVETKKMAVMAVEP